MAGRSEQVRSGPDSGTGEGDACRIDIWLWRARFVKTRGLAAEMVEKGAVRLTHNGQQTRLDKPSRLVRSGDQLTFVRDGRVTALKVEALGERRGPANEARTLYRLLDDRQDRPA